MFDKKAYTLIEIVIVISFIAILSLISFASFSSYLETSRDTNRITQLVNISDGIILEKTKGKILKPDGGVKVYNGSRLYSTQGFFGRSLINDIGLSSDGLDPKNNLPYTYVVSADGGNFQLMALLETEKAFKKAGYQNFLIKDNKGRVPYIKGSRDIGIVLNDDIIPLEKTDAIVFDLQSNLPSKYINLLLSNKEIISDYTGEDFIEILEEALNND